MQIIYALLFACALGGIFATGYYLNSKTPKPPGCEAMEESCEGCGITTCSHHPQNNENEKKEDNNE